MQKILIVEDDGDIAAIERDYLELNNYQVEIAADGLAGLERGLHGDFDGIMLRKFSSSVYLFITSSISLKL